jgi:hypothetical protein
VWRISITGDWEKTVPRIADAVLDCAIYLYRSEKDASKGESSGGSGFLVGVLFEEEWTASPSLHHIYAVTNAHVIEDGFPIVRINTKDGQTHSIPLRQDDWTPHPAGDDVAVAPIELDKDIHQFKYMDVSGGELFMTDKIATQVALGPGDEVFMIGRLLIRETDRQFNAPIARFGHIAASFPELIDQGPRRDNFKQQSFLIEAHSIGGLSGSPVFVWIPADRQHMPTNAELRSRYKRLAYRMEVEEYFLGIDWGHFPSEYERVYRGAKLSDTDYWTPSNSGYAGVVPAWKLEELLHFGPLREKRLEKEKRVTTRRRRGPVLDTKRSPTQTTPERDKIPIPRRTRFLTDLEKATRKRK